MVCYTISGMLEIHSISICSIFYMWLYVDLRSHDERNVKRQKKFLFKAEVIIQKLSGLKK